MAVTYSAKGAFASGTGALTVAVPTGYAAGDLLLMVCESANQTFTTPTGWTALSTAGTGTAGTAGAVRIACFWKIAGASEASVTVADTGDHTTAIMFLFKGNNLTNPIIQATSTTAAANTAVTFPALTVSKAGTMIVYALASDRDSASTANFNTWANSQLVSVTEAHDQTHTSGFGGGVGMAYGICSTARSLQAGTCTDVSVMAHCMSTIGIQPPFGTDVPVMTAVTGLSMAGNKQASEVVDAINATTGLTFAPKKNASKVLDAITGASGISFIGGKLVLKAIGDMTAVSGFAVGSVGAQSLATYSTSTYATVRAPIGVEVGVHAVLVGGQQVQYNMQSYVYSWDDTLTRTVETNLSAITAEGTGAGISFLSAGYALIAVGSSNSAVVNAYNTSMTRSTPTALSVGRGQLTGGTVGDYACFAGGYSTVRHDAVDAYDTSLTRTTPTVLSVARSVRGASIGNYLLFAGGYTTSFLTTVDAYDTSLTRSTPTALSAGRSSLIYASNNDYAMFLGGSNGSYVTTVDAYDASLTRSTPTALTVACAYNQTMAKGIGNYVVVAGKGTIDTAVTLYDETLTRSVMSGALSVARNDMGLAKTGDYFIMGGGYINTTTGSSIVDILKYTPAGGGLGGTKGGLKALDDLTATTGISTAGKKQATGAPTFTGVGELSVVWKKNASETLDDMTAVTGLQFVTGKLVSKVLGVIGTATTGISAAGKKQANKAVADMTAVSEFVIGGGSSPASIARYGNLANIYFAYGNGTGAVGNYGLIGGGQYNTTYYDTVYAYDTSLTRSSPTALSEGRRNLTGSSNANYLIFAGGYNGTANSAVADAYDTSLTRSTPTALSAARHAPSASKVGDYALFAGSMVGGSTVIDAYDTSLTRSTPTALSSAREFMASAHNSNYALFAGGEISAVCYDVVEAYNASLTRSTPTALSVARSRFVGGHAGNYAIFAGGWSDIDSVVSAVDAYDTSLTRATPTALSPAFIPYSSSDVGCYVVFAGGGGYTNVQAIDDTLARTVLTGLSASGHAPGTSVGNYALFGGGDYDGSTKTVVVEAYQYTPASGGNAGGVKGGRKALDALSATPGIATAGKKQTTRILGAISAATGLQFVGGKLVSKALGVIGTATTGISANGTKQGQRILGAISAVAGFNADAKKNTSRVLGTIGTSATGITINANKNAARILGTIGTATTGLSMSGMKRAVVTLGALSAVTGLSFAGTMFIDERYGTFNIQATGAFSAALRKSTTASATFAAAGSFNVSPRKNANKVLDALSAVTGINAAGKKGGAKALATMSSATGISTAGKKQAAKALDAMAAVTNITNVGKKGASKALSTIAATGAFNVNASKAVAAALNAFTASTGFGIAGAASEGVTGSFAITGTAVFQVAGKKGAAQEFNISGQAAFTAAPKKHTAVALNAMTL
jgi:hypothetical protein